MKTKTKLILLLETTLLIHLIFRCISLQQSVSYYRNLRPSNPLINAVLYETTLPYFKEMVKENQDWINNTPQERNLLRSSILSLCARKGLTNHMKILLENGADIQEAIDWHTKFGNLEAVNILNKYKDK